ncbi:hypothetical protein DRQ33_04190 [bacterium]|nr:MAG: hypothetical protein DRQ33_04190 [bacterium]
MQISFYTFLVISKEKDYYKFMSKLRDIMYSIGGFILSIGLPFTHIFGYVGGIFGLPALFDRKKLTYVKSVVIMMCAFLLYCIILAIFAEKKSLAFIGTLNYFAHWIIPFVLGICLGKRAMRFLKIYVVMITVVIVIGLCSFIGIFPKMLLGEKIWSEGMLWCFHHHNALAGMLILAIPIAFHLGGLYAMIFPILSVGLILTGSRGYFIATPLLIIGIVLYAIKKGSKYWIILIILTILISGVALLTSDVRNRVDTMFGGKWQTDLPAYSRLGYWQIAGWIFQENPIFGIGPGQLRTRTDLIQKLEEHNFSIDEKTAEIKHLHNFYLTTLAETGIVGLLFILSILYLLGKKLWNSGELGKLFGWGYFAFLIGNLFDSQMRGPSAAMDLFFLSGLIMAISAHSDTNKKHRESLVVE